MERKIDVTMHVVVVIYNIVCCCNYLSWKLDSIVCCCVSWLEQKCDQLKKQKLQCKMKMKIRLRIGKSKSRKMMH